VDLQLPGAGCVLHALACSYRCALRASCVGGLSVPCLLSCDMDDRMCICAGWESVDRPLLACSVVTYIAGCVFACVQAGEGRCHQVQAACPATGPVGL